MGRVGIPPAETHRARSSGGARDAGWTQAAVSVGIPIFRGSGGCAPSDILQINDNGGHL